MTAFSVALKGAIGALALTVEFEAPPEGLLLIGPNGAGKSTLLSMILGIRRAVSGHIRIGDSVLFDSERGIDLPPESRSLGYVPQTLALFPHLSVRRNVAFGIRDAGSRHQRLARAQELLDAMGVGPIGDRDPRTLSGGEKQRVALARALAARPRALLLDEPLAALDATSREEMRAFLAERLASWALPALIVTHDLGDAVALRLPIAVLERGSVVQRGPLPALAARPETDFVRRFVAGLQRPANAAMHQDVD